MKKDDKENKMSLLTKHKRVEAGNDDFSWDHCIESYLLHLKALGMAERTYRESVYPLYQFKRYCHTLGIDVLTCVTEKNIVGYSKVQLDRIKASTLITKLLTLKGFFKYLAKQRVISHDVSLNIRVPKVGKSLPRDVLSPVQFVKLVGVIDTSCIHGFLYRAIIELLYGTGIRISELISLKLRDIDIEDGKVHISSSKTLKDRILPLTESSLLYLDSYLRYVRPNIVSFTNSMSNVAFLNIKGHKVNPRSVNSKLKCYTVLSGIEKDVKCHTFRYAFASHLYENSCDIRYINELLGHRSLSMTAKYIQVSKKALVEIVKRHHPREKGRV